MIKDRIIEILEYKGIKKEDFYVKIGMTSASFRGKAKESPLNSTAIENILSEIPDLNAVWLLTGRGDKLINSDAESKQSMTLEDKFFDIICKKDKKIEEQATTIGRLEERINTISKKSTNTLNIESARCIPVEK